MNKAYTNLFLIIFKKMTSNKMNNLLILKNPTIQITDAK